MNISGDTGSVDFLKLVEDLPKNLAQMAALRDELAKRQGAMSAVEDAAKAREEAAAYSAKVKADVDALKEDAKGKHDAAVKKAKDLDAREKAFSDAESDTKVANEVAAKALTAREKAVAAREDAAAKRDADLQAKLEAYNAEKATFDERVKAFQAKVSALTV